MGLFNRIKNSISADLHEVEKVRKLLERQYLLKEEFTKEYNVACQFSEKRKQQVEIALRAGESELREFASQEQVQYEERSVRIRSALEKTTLQLVELEKKYEEMKHKLKDMNLKRLELMGQENIARANYRMNQVVETGFNYSNNAATSVSETESYLDRLEQKVNSDYYRSTIDSRISQLEKEQKKDQSHSIS